MSAGWGQILESRSGRVVLAVHVAVLAAVASLLLVDVGVSLVVGVNDDAGYYFRVGRNEVIGYPGTYDWLHPTNGFNPLFKFLLVACYAQIDSQSLDACYRVGVALTFLFSVGCLVLFARLMWRMVEGLGFEPAPWKLLQAMSLFYLTWMVLKEYYGTDGFLVLFFQLFFVNVYLWRTPHLLVKFAALGVLALLATLARLDALSFVAAFLFFFLLLSVRGQLSWKCLVAFVLPVAVGLGLYLFSNHAAFGVLLPVSGMLKNSFPHVDVATAFRTINFTSSSLLNSAVLYASLFVGFAYSLAMLRDILRGRWPQLATNTVVMLMVPLSLYACAHTLFYVLFSRFDFQGLYIMFLNVYLLMMVVVWMRGPMALRMLSPQAATSTLAAIFLVGAVALFALRTERMVVRLQSDEVDERTIGHDLEALTGDEDVLFGDSYGLVGFFTRRAFINGDGVVNSPTYLQVLASRETELIPYLYRERVTHLFGNTGSQLIPGECQAGSWIREWKSERGRLALCRLAVHE